MAKMPENECPRPELKIIKLNLVAYVLIALYL